VDLYNASTPRQPRHDCPVTGDRRASGQGFYRHGGILVAAAMQTRAIDVLRGNRDSTEHGRLSIV